MQYIKYYKVPFLLYRTPTKYLQHQAITLMYFSTAYGIHTPVVFNKLLVMYVRLKLFIYV